MTKQKEDFEVVMATDVKEDDTVILTMDERGKQWLAEAMDRYDPTNRQYSVYLNDSTSTGEGVTQDLLDTLAKNPQNDLSKINRINILTKAAINGDDIIGKTVESIETNVNTEYKLSYKKSDDENTLNETKALIDNFNEQINVGRIIRRSVPATYRNGTYIMYLRHDGNDYVVDTYPLGVAIISNYEVGGDPYVLIDINELTARLRKEYTKTKKQKPLFFKNIDEEIKCTYPKEVYEAYKNKDNYAKLDIKYSGVMRIGNLDGKYGLTPIFRALSASNMLKQFANTDNVTSKTNSKKIIVQLLNKEIMGQNYQNDRFDLVAWCHENLLRAWKTSPVITTCSPAVRDVKYIESQTQLTDVNTVNNYRSKVMATLGIGFLMDSGSTSVSTASISIDQLLKCINKISEQLEDVLRKWYKQILTDNGLNYKLAPDVKVIDAEQLDFEMKKSLATLLFSTMNASYETSLGVLGIDVADEIAKKQQENDGGYDNIFKPHGSQYTNNSNADDKEAGRPEGDDKDKMDKQNYDKERNKTIKKE